MQYWPYPCIITSVVGSPSRRLGLSNLYSCLARPSNQPTLDTRPLNKNKKELTTVDQTRRNLLLAGVAGSLLPTTVMAASRGRNIVYPDRSLALFNVHTGEKNKVVYWSDGKYVGSGLNEINWILRDFRTGEIKAIDPRLLNILYLLTRTLETEKPVLVLSGFRSKKTNDMLRKTTEGVAKRSFHMAGRAIDIRIPRIETSNIQVAALRLNGGGVGYYPRSNFVHLDSGPVRTW